tara:strand:+ start:27299 stop:28135 length:837 start_codon:yes stop_codon:yes gene_type:complete
MSKPEVAVHRSRKIAISKLKPHPRNYRSHPEEQIDQIKASIESNGFYRNVVLANDLTILAGHGVVIASESLGMPTVPCIVLECEPDSSEALKVLVGDNYVSRLAEDDSEILTDVLADLQIDGDLLGTGFDDIAQASQVMVNGGHWVGEEDGAGESEDEGGAEGGYTHKIVSPVYEPNGDCPEVSDLFNSEVTQKLVAKINKAKLPEDIKEFMLRAAERHTVFRFDRIANYYAHAPKKIQRLMEDSALVIIDFDQAIEKGFVKMTKRIDAMFGKDYPDA